MNVDNTRINSIEYKLKSDPKKVSTNDIIYYLKYASNNTYLEPDNLDNFKKYLEKINYSYSYENIFINKSNYGSIVFCIIGLLIPFYYTFPRFYKLGFIGLFIGIISFMGLFSRTNSLYYIFFNNVGTLFITLSIIIYLVFFILLNKLNHISLFFISSIMSFLIISYILRVKLTLPFNSNIYNKYNASMNNNTKYIQYNETIEIACIEIISRYNLLLPSGNMLYSYLTIFDIGDNTNKYSDFFTNLFGPFIAIFILWILGLFLSNIKENNVNLFPIIGLDENSVKYLTCQANYILPKELNVNLLIYDLLNKYDFSDKIYVKVEKVLLRISKELLHKYNPKFYKKDESKEDILKNLKNNKIYIELIKLLKKNNYVFNINIDYIDKINDIIDKEQIPYKNKLEMLDLLKHIDNTLQIINEKNEDYQNDSELAIDEFLYDKEIDKENKNSLKEIVYNFKKNFVNNLNLDNGTLFGYHYNILTYSFLNNNSRIKSNEIFSSIIRLISTWLLLAKPIGSPWLLSNYIAFPKNEFKEFIKKLSGKDSILWKYFIMGMDKSYFEQIYENMQNNNEISNKSDIMKFLNKLLPFIFLLLILNLFNSSVFGLTLSPSWFNLLYQLLFIINIIGNIYTYNKKGSLISFNIYFFLIFIFVVIFISAIMYFTG